jgi:hypothetical protein
LLKALEDAGHEPSGPRFDEIIAGGDAQAGVVVYSYYECLRCGKRSYDAGGTNLFFTRLYKRLRPRHLSPRRRCKGSGGAGTAEE